MEQDFRVSVRTLDLLAGDRFLLCTDGLTISVDSRTLWTTMRAVEPPSVVASELLSHALAARSPDNVAVLVVDCREQAITEELDTRRYNEVPLRPPSSPPGKPSEGPSSSDFRGPEILTPADVEVVEQWNEDSEFPTVPLMDKNGEPISQPVPELPETPAPAHLNEAEEDSDGLELTVSEVPGSGVDFEFPPSEDGEDLGKTEDSSPNLIEEGDLEFEEDEESAPDLDLSVVSLPVDKDPNNK
jgi:hypothetical protein